MDALGRIPDSFHRDQGCDRLDGGRQSGQPRANIPWCVLSKLSTQVAFSFSARACLHPVYASGEPGLTPAGDGGGGRQHATLVFIKPVWVIQQRCGRPMPFGAPLVCYAGPVRGNHRLEPNIYLFRRERNCFHPQAPRRVLFLRYLNTANPPPNPQPPTTTTTTIASAHRIANVIARR